MGTAAVSPWRFVVAVGGPNQSFGIGEVSLPIAPAGGSPVSLDGGRSLNVDVDSPLEGPFNFVEVTANDADALPQSLRWNVVTAPTQGTTRLDGDPSSPGSAVRLRYQPTTGFTGVDRVTLEVRDGFGTTARHTVTVNVGGSANTPTWRTLNGGQPLDPGQALASRPQTESASLPDGFWFSARAVNLGRVMYRVTPTGRFEALTTTGLVNGSGISPSSLEGALHRFGSIVLAPHPTRPNAIFGVTAQGLRLGEDDLDMHGFASQFTLEQGRMSFWNGGVSDAFNTSRQLVVSYGGTGGSGIGFGYDPVEKEGLLLGRVSGWAYDGKLTASRLDFDDATLRWRRWHQETGQSGGWSARSDWPDSNDAAASSRMWVLDSLADPRRHVFMGPVRVVHLTGTRVFAIAAMLRRGASEGVLVASYDGATQRFSFWNGTTFEAAEQPTSWLDRAPLTPVGPGQAFELVAQPSGRALLFAVDPAGLVTEQSLDTVARTLSAPVVVGPAGTGRVFSSRQPTGEVWQVFAQGPRALLRRRATSGTWMSPQLIAAHESTLDVAGLGLAGTRPLALIETPRADGTSLMAVGPAAEWPSETPLSLAPRPTGHSADPQHLFLKGVMNGAPGMSYGATTPLGLASDGDGYVYASNPPVCSVIVHPPTSQSLLENVTWGKFWDHFSLPGAVAVWPARNKVFTTNQIAIDGSGGLVPVSQLVTVDHSLRTQSLGYYDFRGVALAPQFDQTFKPQRLSLGTGWATGLALDPAAGLLFVAGGTSDEILVYDVHNTINNDGFFPRANFGTEGARGEIVPSNRTHLDAIVSSLVAANLVMASSDGLSLRWVTTSWAAVESAVRSDPAYALVRAADAGNDANDILRNLREHFTHRRELPVLLYRQAMAGAGPGQLSLPQGLAMGPMGQLYVVDSNNHRVNVYSASRTQLTFVRSLGSVGHGPGQLFYPSQVAVTSAGVVYVSDPLNHRVVVFSPAGAPAGALTGWVDENGLHALQSPFGVDTAQPGKLLVGSGDKVLHFTRP